MWIPESAEAIERAVNSRTVEEGPTFDAKASLPAPGKNKDIAKDVAAMANDGGVLIYGIDEDANGDPTVPCPFTLAGAAERIDNVVQMDLSEPADIQDHDRPLASDPTKGYLVVVVPASPRAPHQVILDKEYRYYKRLDKISVPMNEGEVARLYERRQRWEVDRDELLAKAVGRNHKIWPPLESVADLHLVVRPVTGGGQSMIRKTAGRQAVVEFLSKLFQAARHAYLQDRIPEYLTGHGGWQPRDSGWCTGHASIRHTVDLTIGDDGLAHLFARRIAEVDGAPGYLALREDRLAGTTARAIAMVGELYRLAAYTGPADIGLAVTGMEGFGVYSPRFPYAEPLPRSEDYRRTARVTAGELGKSTTEVARSLVDDLIGQVTDYRYDPFS